MMHAGGPLYVTPGDYHKAPAGWMSMRRPIECAMAAEVAGWLWLMLRFYRRALRRGFLLVGERCLSSVNLPSEA